MNKKYVLPALLLILLLVLGIFLFLRGTRDLNESQEGLADVNESHKRPEVNVSNEAFAEEYNVQKEDFKECIKNQSSSAPEVVPFIKDDVTICNDYPGREKICKQNYYRFKALADVNSASECDFIPNEGLKNLCLGYMAKDVSKCDEIGFFGFGKELCRAVHRADMKECSGLEPVKEMECKRGYIFYKAIRSENVSECDLIKDLKLNESDKYSSYLNCKDLVRRDMQAYKTRINRTCYLENVVVNLNTRACNFTSPKYKEKCKRQVEKVLECVNTSGVQAKKQCVRDVVPLHKICGNFYVSDQEELMNSISQWDESQIGVRRELIKNNPELCVKG